MSSGQDKSKKNEGSGWTSGDAEAEDKGRGRGGRGRGYSSGRGRARARGRGDYERRGYRGRYSRRGRDDDYRPRTVTPAVYTSCEHRTRTDVPEDSRISTTLRRLAREDDETVFSSLCLLLQNSLRLGENEVYVRRSLDQIDESLLETLRFCQGDSLKLEAAHCIAHVGYNASKEFHRFMEWIFRKINNENNVKTREYLLRAVLELAHLDAENPKLSDYIKDLMKELYTVLETTDSAEVFMLTAEILLLLTRNYGHHFAQFFHDTIDIMVGWQIDSTQPPSVGEFCCQSLRSLWPYWVQDVKFTVTLLTQILEDAHMYSEEDENALTGGQEQQLIKQEAYSKTTSFIKAFQAVFEGARDAMDPSQCKKISWTFHSDAIVQIFNTVLNILNVQIYCPVVCAGNYCAVTIMKYLKYKTDTVQTSLLQYINRQLDVGEELDSSTIESLLTLLAKVIGEGGFELSGGLVDRLFSGSCLLMKQRFGLLCSSLIPLYQALLKHKDVVLIRSAYRLMMLDLEAALSVLCPNKDMKESDSTTLSESTDSPYSLEEAEVVVQFYLDTLLIISKRGGALFWVFVVKPSLFDLCAVRLLPTLSPLQYPALFHSALVLLKSHCSYYGEFVHTSALVRNCPGNPLMLHRVNTLDGSIKTSVTASVKVSRIINTCSSTAVKVSLTKGHLSVIMKLIGSLLKMVMSEDTKLILVLWGRHVLLSLKPYLEVLDDSEELLSLAGGVLRACGDRCRTVALAGVRSLHILAQTSRFLYKTEQLVKVLNLCTSQINSSSRKLQAAYLRLLELLPPLTVVFGVQHYCKDPRGYKRNLESSLYSSMVRGDAGEIQDVHFSRFMEFVFHGAPPKWRNGCGWMEDVVSRCWAVLEFDLGQRCMASQRALLDWGAWQCASLAVNQRLKTPLGKPALTLVSIENVIQELWKEVVEGKVKKGWREGWNGQRVRLLVQFIEHLEKLMYNATQGTAYALTPPHQNVKQFLKTNKGTCSEWLNRVRLSLMFVCLHAGLAPYSVRHGQAYLQHLVDSNNTQGWEFITGVTYTGWALANLYEPDAVVGLYQWAKGHGVKVASLKPLSAKASRRFEEAADGFQQLVVDETSRPSAQPPTDKHPPLSHNIFVADQLVECYLSLNSWEELLSWKQAENLYLSTENPNSFHLHKGVASEFINSIKEAEERGKVVLGEWSGMDSLEYDNSDKPSWNHYDLLHSTSQHLVTLALQLRTTDDTSLRKMLKEKVKYSQEKLDEIIKESLKESTSELFSSSMVLKYAAASLYNGLNLLENQSLGEVSRSVTRRLRNPEMSLLLRWSSLLSDLPTKNLLPTKRNTDLYLKLTKVARKESNLKMARVCLLKFFRDNIGESFNVGMSLMEAADCVAKTTDFGSTSDHLVSLNQLTKLLHTSGEELTAWKIAVRRCELALQSPHCNNEERAHSLCALASWALDNHLTTQISQPLQNLVTVSNEFSNQLDGYLIGSGCLSDVDCMIWRLLRDSVACCYTLSKSWRLLAEASHSWARRPIPASVCSIDPSSLPPGVDVESIQHLIAKTPPTIHIDDIDMESTTGRERFEQQLSEIPLLSSHHVSLLTSEWNSYHAPVFNYLSLSAYSYFKFLDHYNDKDCVLAALRLVRLLVKHPQEMELLYQEEMGKSPTSAWVCVVPQLFSRLSHPHPYPRKKITELLVRIGTDYPHLIAFPAVVGSKTGVNTIHDMPNTKLFASNKNEEGTKDEEMDEEIKFFEDEEEPEAYDDEDSSNKDEVSSILENSFITIVDSLSKQSGGRSQLSEVGVLVSELRRITVLFDELWLGTLKQRQADTARRFSRLCAETKLTLSNQHLSQETKNSLITQKHSLILKPLLFVLEQLHSVTSVPPETPHEQNFQLKYSDIIEETLTALREPSNPQNPEETFSIVKRLEQALAGGCENKAHGVGTGGTVHSMAHISPVMASLTNTAIPMPGLDRTSVTIASVVDTVHVLQTMTKPKKLTFIGSDGKQYTYLFKGLEDLHLDERIMQLLCTANSMLEDESLRARHYSVVPLGPRSGLISWVDSVTPIFSLYKRWQQRDHSSNSQGWMGVARPSELYYSLLTPLLTEAGFKPDPSHRSTWPLYLLKKALTLLTNQTPSDLLAKELWCYSGSCGWWWESTKLYSTSLAVMSIIGYMIGLGDRHLDNVMVNLRTGQVVHIDYNVCFEKGKTLRIPEKVPYRLTPNLVAALGITGIEGLFRSTCEKVLEVLQKEKETLLTLLEAFVYDPLIDWTPLNETGYTGAVYGGGRGLGQEMRQTRRQLERQVTLSMFSVRVVEVSHQWTVNKEKIAAELSMFISLVEDWLKNNEKLNDIMSKLQERHSQMALLKEAEGQSNHPLYSLSSRYEAYSTVYSTKQQVLNSLTSRLRDADLLINHYQSVVEVLRSQTLTKYLREVNARPKKDLCTVFDLIKEFLQTSGQKQMVIQCAESERLMCQYSLEQNELTTALIELLSQYWEIVSNNPPSLLLTHRAYLYKKWSLLLLEDMSPQRCSQVEFEMSRELCLREDRMLALSSYYVDLVRLAEATSAEAMRPLPVLPPTSIEPVSRKSLQPFSEVQVVAAVCKALVATNCKFLRLESAASSAGEYLVNLTSREGNWFLEDMVTLSCIVQQLVSLLPAPQPDSELYRLYKTLSAIHSQYKALQDMDMNVRGIILFEAVHNMRREEPTVVLAAKVIENVALSAQQPLSALSNRLRLNLKTTLISQEPQRVDLESENKLAEDRARMLEEGFASVMASVDSTDVLSPGQMLLLGFNGVFSSLERDIAPLVALFSSLQLPSHYHCIDHVIDSKQYPVELCKSERGVEKLLLYLCVCRLEAMQETLRACSLDCEGYKTGCYSPSDPIRLSRPVRLYIANYVLSSLLGLLPTTLALTVTKLLEHYLPMPLQSLMLNEDGSLPNRVNIDELCNKLIETKLGGLVPVQLMKLVEQSVVETRTCETRRMKELETSSARASLGRHTLLMTAFYWLHEHYLPPSPPPPINRAEFMMEMRKTVAAILGVQGKISDTMEKQQVLISSAEQRLRWTSGANPDLTEVLSAFENSVATHRQNLVDDQRRAMQVSNLATWILQYEALRTTNSETLNSDAAFALLVKECCNAYCISEENKVSVSAVEEGLVNLAPPPPVINHQWIATAEHLVSESIRSLNKEVEPLQKEMFTSEDCIKSKSLCIRYDMGTHNNIMSDIRELFKTMIKFEDAKEMGLEDYLLRYKDYTDKMSRMTKWFTSHEIFSHGKLQEILDTAKLLLAITNDIYEDLLKLSFSKDPLELTSQIDSHKTHQRVLSHTKSVQEKNSYAVGVWRRIKLKLEGRDPDPGITCSVPHQVDWTIKEAMSPDNLATLYEGWTPWV